MVLERSDLVEKGSWKKAKQLTDEEVESELLIPLIAKLNEHREIDTTWNCAGNTLVAAARQRLGDKELPTFLICQIRKRLESTKTKQVSKKEDLLCVIAQIFDKHHSLSFGQLISNALQHAQSIGGRSSDLFRITDEELIQALREYDRWADEQRNTSDLSQY